ncbi:MAG: endonuclease [Erysipelotrichaceae bacterium]|nr:endonuclease [Erysipelotrichaceae bacterium]
MRKKSKLFVLVTTLLLISSCKDVSLTSSEDNSSIIEDSSSNIEISSSEIESVSKGESSIESSEESSSIEESSSEESSIIDESSSEEESSSSEEEIKEEKTFTLDSSNFDTFEGITMSNVIENTSYTDEFTICVEGYITTSNITSITKIETHVYSTYNNLTMYEGSSSSGKVVEPSVVNASDNKSAYYTYEFTSPVDSFYLLNTASTYNAHVYTITITYTGECNISKKEENNNPGGGDVIVDGDGWTNSDFKNYYSTIDLSLSGNYLLEELQSLNASKQKKTVGYSGLWNYFDQTDYDPNNSSKYLAFYRGTSATKGEMNKEHVWPKSRGGGLVDGDLHMTRPTLTSDNSSRGNSFYVEGKNSSSAGWDPKAANMNEQYRGQVARILFYCVVANKSLSLVDKDNDATSNKTMGKLSDLLKWNLMYPVDNSELRRNNGAQKVQGNRNPFIDNPSFACSIFGSTNSTTKEICSSYSAGDNKVNDTPSDNNQEVIENNDKIIELTSSSLNLTSSYADGNVTISDTSFTYEELGDYGDGIQMRNKEGKGTTAFYNTSAFASSIKQIELIWSSSKDVFDNDNTLTFYFGNDNNVATYQTTLVTKANEKSYVIVPDDDYLYFKFVHTGAYTLYFSSINIHLN